MQEKQTCIFFLEIFVIVAVLGFLAAIAIPNIGKMMNNSKAVSRETELHDVQTAVTEMLFDSAAGALESVGPTADMSLVCTRDTPPLVLKDYLLGLEDSSVKLGCTYSFAADGTVLQTIP